MKHLKRIGCFVMALMLLCSLMAVPAFAAGTGTITINNISAGNHYEIYRLLDLESYDTTSGAYSYKVNSDWEAFFATTEAQTYFAVDGDDYATWIAAEDDDTVASFAKLALAYAKANGIAPVESSRNSGDMEHSGSTGKFSGLELGYYLIDSTVGALCGLTTTNPDASINAKNHIPTHDKQVEEDSTKQYGDNNTADIGQIITFRTTINVHAGAENFVLHDIMSSGLTFKSVTKIEHVVPGTDTHTVDTTKYTVKSGTELTDGCTFEVRFSQELCDELETNDKLIVYYEVMLNREAVVAGEGNSNKSRLEYGENNFTEFDETKTYTYGFDLVKTDSQNKLIDGAEFKIYDAETGGNEVAVVLMDDNVTYRRARTDETGVAIKVKDGKVRVVGMDNGTYYLEETVSPVGFNQLSGRQKFIISDGNLDAVFNDGIFSTGSGVHVVNKAGTMLPETGGIGTTLFYVGGGLMVAVAVVLLITKKRMDMKG